jgi:hypothetical protein
MKSDLLFLRHGISSRWEALEGLANRLRQIPGTLVDNSESHWKEPVLTAGLRLAEEVVTKFDESLHERIILIGHSQGGLISRVAAVAICDPDFVVQERADALAEGKDSFQEKAQKAAPYLRGVIMLATPNAGAFTFGQMSIAGRLLLHGATKIADLRGIRDLADLTTDRLFRILQRYRVAKVNYLSISGSMVSRYSRLSHDDLAEIPLISRLGVHLEKPNDGLVEDSSVDLSQAPLPSEIYDPESQYEHVRVYRDCIDVSHVSIHGNELVVGIIRNRLARW